jgi:alkanesulfonate monooxygenase SsuD/methylene tetrahydromethanopterin reductase-like flavin-dependent oxidoreductase (luciferase family)
MRTGIFLPPFDGAADPRFLTALAADAEANGWDGFFLWDHVMYRPPVEEVADPWIAMAAIAMATERVRFGALVTPLARRRPQIVARQAATLDHLSGGRLVLGVGLGLDRSGRELSAFGEEGDDRTRAAMLDEALEVITDLWSGEPVRHQGEHYLVDDATFLPPPVQRPRIPVWVGARWPYRRPLRRAARWDGLFAIDFGGPQDLAEALHEIRAARGDLEGFDVVCTGAAGDDPRPWADAGATWWLVDPFSTDPDVLRGIVAARPGEP